MLQILKRSAWKAFRNASWKTTGKLLEWKRQGYLHGISVAVDVGAYVGHYTESLVAVFPGMPVYAVEPYRSTFNELQRRFAARKRVVPINCAVADLDGEADLFVSNMEQANSLLPMAESHKLAWPSSPPVSSARVRTRSLDSLAQEHGWTGPAFIKLDIQGAEIQALQSGVKLLKTVQAVQVEVNLEPLYIGCPGLGEIFAFFTEQQFQLVDSFDFLVAPGKSLPSSCDMLFVAQKGLSR